MPKGESVQAVQELQRLTIGVGSVDPAARIAAGEIEEAVIANLVERLKTDEFYDDIPEVSIPCVCMDCRGRAGGTQVLGGNAAGGTFTLVVADALTHNSYRHAGENSAQHAKRMYAELNKREKPELKVGGHDADTATGSNCGCGAQDKLDSKEEDEPSILRFLVNRADDVRSVVRGFGFEASDELHDDIVGKAVGLRESGYAAPGIEVRQATIEAVGDESVETLTGPQLAVAAVVNTRAGKTLNRKKVAEVYGDAYQVFNVDVPTILNGAREISISKAEAAEKTIAAIYYNVATAAVIVGPSMPLVVR